MGKKDSKLDVKPNPVPVQKKDHREVPGKRMKKTQGGQEDWTVTEDGYTLAGPPVFSCDIVPVFIDDDTGVISFESFSVQFCPRGYRVQAPGINNVWCPIASMAFGLAKNKNPVIFTGEDDF